jgi:flagellar hook-associated protein 1
LFFGSLTSLAANPANSATRENVLAAATALATAFNSAANQLQSISSNLNQQVGSIVNQANALTSTIAKLNGQIANVSPGTDAGALEDQRQEAIGQLSQFVGLDQVSTDHNGIELTTTDGSILVGGNSSYALTTAQVGGVAHILAGPSSKDVTSTLGGGELGGALIVRDQELPQVVGSLDSLAYAIGNQVNTQNSQGLDANGNAGAAIFSFSNGVTGAAASITVSATSPSALAAASSGQGSSGNGNAQLLAGISSVNLVGGSTASNFCASLLSQIGSNAANATSDTQSLQAGLSQVTSQRDALSGVSLDQEASNLTQYQRSYQAAAKVFSIADTIMASALNLGEDTTVA